MALTAPNLPYGMAPDLREALSTFFQDLALDVARADLVGSIRIWPNATAPEGYVICDGTEYPTERLPELYKLIGTTFGSSGADLFEIPTLAGPASGLYYIIRVG